MDLTHVARLLRAAELSRLDHEQRLGHNLKQCNGSDFCQQDRRDVEQTFFDHAANEEPLELEGADLPSHRSKEAVSARIRWLVETHFEEGTGRIRLFSEQTGMTESKAKNLIYGLNSPNSDDLEVMCDFFQVEPRFILWGDLTHMRFEMMRKVRGNQRLRELLASKDVPIPEYLLAV